ncbi:MAG: Hpt domain-containing protein [Defluviitaleaceae bacterium]|nr:Hpt domain-containing protein [Defluviitaleaceae bacterium]
MSYDAYLPDIDVLDGKARVMNNMGLYLRLLGKFDGAKMAEDITRAMKEEDLKCVASASHALRGTAANLGFPVVQKVTTEIEALAKEGKDAHHLAGRLNEAVSALSNAIGMLVASQA